MTFCKVQTNFDDISNDVISNDMSVMCFIKKFMFGY